MAAEPLKFGPHKAEELATPRQEHREPTNLNSLKGAASHNHEATSEHVNTGIGSCCAHSKFAYIH
jgi:hypothetical protein